MEFVPSLIADVIRIRPKVHGDNRGFFLELFQSEKFAAAGIAATFVQDNLSRSSRGVLRGLHYQIQRPQGKLVTVLQGEIFDVAVDLRRSSPSFGRWVGATLSDQNREMLYVPPGFAHGFCVMSETADVFYKCTELYAPQHERTVLWSDASIGIDWPVQGEPNLSHKDRQGVVLAHAELFD